MSRYLCGLALLMLVACSAEVPSSFADPDVERERLEDAVDASCEQERPNYWFCTAENGFFHIFLEPTSQGPMVRTVMLDRKSDAELQQDLAALYGFSPEQLVAVRDKGEGEIAEGGFVLHLDPTWNEPVIQVNTAAVEEIGK